MECANPRTRIAIPWSDLPPELLQNISKRLRSEIQTLRFRAVCHSWRSSTPPFKFPTIKLPFPFDAGETPNPEHSGAYFTLTERVVYHIQLPHGKSPDFWIVKLEHAGDGKVRIINPVTHRRIDILRAVGMPKVLNLLDFDVSEVCKGYALRYVNPSKESDDYYDYRHAKKVSANVDNGEYVVMAIDLRCRLWSITSGGEKWSRCTPLFNNHSPGRFYDVANINGQLHVADAAGVIWCVDSEIRWWSKGRCIGSLPLSLPLKRRSVELCNGELVLVQEMRKAVLGLYSTDFPVEQPFVDIEIYAQVLEEWRDVRATHGCIIVLSDDCSFPLPATEKLKAARVFYPDRYVFLKVEHNVDVGEYTCFECDCRGDICLCLRDYELDKGDNEVANAEVKRLFEGCHGENIGVCNFRTGEIGTALMYPEYASIFWPPPSWLSRE